MSCGMLCDVHCLMRRPRKPFADTKDRYAPLSLVRLGWKLVTFDLDVAPILHGSLMLLCEGVRFSENTKVLER